MPCLAVLMIITKCYQRYRSTSGHWIVSRKIVLEIFFFGFSDTFAASFLFVTVVNVKQHPVYTYM